MPRLGRLAVVTGADPAATVEWTYTVPAATWYELLSVTITIVQGATQTPQPLLQVTDGTTVLFESFGSTTAQAASTTQRYTWAPGHPLSGNVGATTNVHSTGPLPSGMIVGPGYKLGSGTTVGIGANTDFTAPSFLVVTFGADPAGWN